MDMRCVIPPRVNATCQKFACSHASGSSQLFHSFTGKSSRYRCSLPMAYAMPADFKSVFHLTNFLFSVLGLKGQLFDEASDTITALVDALTALRAVPPKLLHWQQSSFKPWNHCGETRTAFDALWWQMRDRACSNTSIPCLETCA